MGTGLLLASAFSVMARGNRVRARHGRAAV